MRKVWIYKRNNIRGWWCGWYEDGKRKSKALPSKELAEHYRHIKYTQLNSDVFTGIVAVDWQEMIDEYREAKKVQGVTEGTLYEHSLSLRNFERIVGKCNSKQITQNVIDKFILERTSEVKRATLNKDIRNIKTFVNWCREQRYLNGNLKLKELKVEDRPVKSLNDTQIKQLLVTAEPYPAMKMRILLALATGLRSGDINSLKISDIDFEKNCLCTTSKKTKKCMASRPVSSEVMSHLSKYLCGLKVGQEKLFRTKFPYRKWRKICKKAGLSDLKFHDLRKTFCSLLAQNGVSTAVTQRLLEHSSGSTMDVSGGGIYCGSGMGVPKDYDKALYYFQKAADQKSMNAQVNLGFMYLFGMGVPQDTQKALVWYHKAAEQGSTEAFHSIGMLYREGRGIQQNYQKAFEWFVKAAEAGRPESQCHVAEMYRDGLWVKQDFEKAFEWYLKSAEQGYMVSQLNVAQLYFDGKGVTKNTSEGVKWLAKAGVNGSQDSLLKLFFMYKNGGGVKPDQVEALKWLVVAEATGFDLPTLKNSLQQNLTEEQIKQARVRADEVIQSNNRKTAPQNFLKFTKSFVVNSDQPDKLVSISPQSCDKLAAPENPEDPNNLFATGKNIYSQSPKGAVEFFQMAAEKGHAKAQAMLGQMYYVGDGVNKDIQKALEWLHKAADKNEVTAEYWLGQNYADKDNPQHDYKKAFYWYQLAAEHGDFKAQNNLGTLYLNGHGVQQDVQKAYDWYLKAANQDDSLAQLNLALLYIHGQGVSRDYSKAAEWLNRSAHLGEMNSQLFLGVLYHTGRGVEKNEAQAYYWIEKAVQQGSVEAQFFLGCMYSTGGTYIEKDLQEAKKLLQMAARQGYDYAKFVLEEVYTELQREKEDQDTFQKFLQSAEKGEPEAQYEVGKRYHDGLGVDKNYIEALRWYRKAAEQEYAKAQTELGIMYMDGEGVEKDFQEALQWLEKAATQLEPKAQTFLASTYADGIEVKKNMQKAIHLFQFAADQGYPPAQYILGFMYYNGSDVEQDDKKAAMWIRKAADQSNAEAQFCLAWMYINGKGVSKDVNEGIQWYIKAAEQGHAESRYVLGQLYVAGKVVKVDYIEAYKWFYLAKITGGDASKALKWLEDRMTFEQIAQAEKRAFKFVGKKGESQNSVRLGYDQELDLFSNTPNSHTVQTIDPNHFMIK